MPGAATFWTNFFSLGLDVAYPRRCCLCGELGPNAICDICFGEFQPTGTLHRPDDPESALDYVASAFLYRGRAAQAVQRLKYERATALAAPLARFVAEGAEALGLMTADLVVPVPIHWTRRWRRGFNQAEMLTSGFEPGKVAGLGLERIRATRPQVGLSPDRRAENLAGAFRGAAELMGKSVLLIDDVSTSGHTAAECARAARLAGAVGVSAFMLCSVR